MVKNKRLNLKNLIYILTILVFGITYAQENKTSDCNLQLENKLWKTEFEKAKSKSERIELIKRKVKSDSIYEQSEVDYLVNLVQF